MGVRGPCGLWLVSQPLTCRSSCGGQRLFLLYHLGGSRLRDSHCLCDRWDNVAVQDSYRLCHKFTSKYNLLRLGKFLFALLGSVSDWIRIVRRFGPILLLLHLQCHLISVSRVCLSQFEMSQFDMSHCLCCVGLWGLITWQMKPLRVKLLNRLRGFKIHFTKLTFF